MNGSLQNQHPRPNMNRHQMQSGIVVAISVLFLAGPSTFAGTESGNRTALLVVAHGSRDTNWNARVIETVERLDWPGPKGVAFLTGKPPEHALPRVASQLDQSAVRRIAVIPLLISSFSDHYEEIRYYVGQRSDMPGHAEEPAPRVKSAAAQEHQDASPLKTKAKLLLTPAMDSHPLLTRILSDQVTALVKEARSESLVLVAHGPNDEAENERWLEHLRIHARRLQEQFGFRRVTALTLRDDAPAPIRNAATEQLRSTVTNAGADSRVLVLPVLISVGPLQKEIRERLNGVNYVMTEGGVATHPLTVEWISQQGKHVAAHED